jgi:hypothetical protein
MTFLEALTDITTLSGKIFWTVIFAVVIIVITIDDISKAWPAPRRNRTAAEDAEREIWLRSYKYKRDV